MLIYVRCFCDYTTLYFRYHVAWSRDCLEKIEVICANAIPATLEEAESDDDKYQTLTRCIDVLHVYHKYITFTLAIVRLCLVIIV